MVTSRTCVTVLLALVLMVSFVQNAASQEQRIALLVQSIDGALIDIHLEAEMSEYDLKADFENVQRAMVAAAQSEYDEHFKLSQRYEDAGLPTNSIQESLEMLEKQLRKEQESLARVQALEADWITGHRKISITVGDGVMRVEHDVHSSLLTQQQAFRYIDQWEYGKKYEFIDAPVGTGFPRNVTITEADHKVNPFKTPTALTLGRGISYYLGAPMDLIAKEDESDCYTLIVWNSDRSDMVARFVLDSTKGFCWKKAEIYQERAGEPTIVAECSDFRESAGVYLPFHCVYKYYGHLGEEKKRALVDRSTYDVTSFSSATVAADLSAEKLIQPDDVVIKPVPAGER